MVLRTLAAVPRPPVDTLALTQSRRRPHPARAILQCLLHEALMSILIIQECEKIKMGGGLMVRKNTRECSRRMRARARL